MTFKIAFIIVPLAVSSIMTAPRFGGGGFINAAPSISSLSDPFDSSLPFITSSINNNREDYFYCDKYGPFSLDNRENFTATFKYEFNSVSSQNVIERIRLFNASNSVVASSSKAAINYQSGQRRTVSFLVPIKDYWSNNGLTLKFEMVNSVSALILKSYSATFYPPSKKTINGSLLKREIYTSKSLGFYGDGEDMKELFETFDFTTLGDYVGVDYYYRLNLANNYFIYSQNYQITCNSVSLRFNDDKNLFPYLTHQANGDVIIPLSLYKNGSAIHFKYKNNFYIDKRTLQISDTYQSDFVSTQDFYLPINGKRLFNNKQLYIDFNGLGLDEISTSLPIKYDIARSLTGVCTDGEYCVIGGKR